MSLDETHALKLLDQHDHILEESLKSFGGQILKRMGDAIFAVFESATSSVSCAVDMQTRLREFNSDKDKNDQIAIRIGIHVGDVVMRNEDLFGEGINVAARLESLAEPGGVCLSQAVYQAIRAHTDIEPQLVGEIELKNILEKQVIYKIASLYSYEELEDAVSLGKTKSMTMTSYDIERIESLDPPRRSFGKSLAFSALSFLLAGATGLLVSLLIQNDYSIQLDDLVDPKAIIIALEGGGSPEAKSLGNGLERSTRVSIADHLGGHDDNESLALVQLKLRKNLNSLIESEVFILGTQDRKLWRDETITLSNHFAESEDKDRTNRMVLDTLFPNELRRWSAPPNMRDTIALLSHVFLKAHPQLLPYLVLTIVVVLFWSAYMYTLASFAITFRDIRNVDDVLEYLVGEMGFNPPVREKNTIIFRATFWTIFLYNVLKLRVSIEGNRVLLTGPLPMMRRFKKRLMSLSS